MIVQCFPLYSILLAIGNPRYSYSIDPIRRKFFRVDFMSLDVEGSELDVLRTIPFDKVDIEVFLIEVITRE